MSKTNICTNPECGKEYVRVQGQGKRSLFCPDCRLDNRVAADERRNQRRVKCGRCGRDTTKSELVPHDKRMCCTVCHVLIIAEQDRMMTIGDFMEANNMHSSGLGGCCEVGGRVGPR